ncbi:MAG: MoaD/ThiS family protein [Deltaproteobacteria bacterium]|jgi:molybdopterin synthase sulfur carrier subunit|nr:MoaD/ThiS family protein [Deltaproteobacteria bacterium]
MPLTVHLPSQLRAYTQRASTLTLADDELQPPTVDGALWALDRRGPGLRFRVIDEQGRVRRHMLIFLGEDKVEDLQLPLAPGRALTLVGALSGG